MFASYIIHGGIKILQLCYVPMLAAGTINRKWKSFAFNAYGESST